MSTAIPGEVWRPTSAEQVQHLGLVEETGNQGDFTGDEHTGGHPKMNAWFGSEWDTLYYFDKKLLRHSEITAEILKAQGYATE
jgi:hypothetical protein